MRQKNVFMLCLTFSFSLWKAESKTRGEEEGFIEAVDNQPQSREKRFSFFQKLKKKKIFQKYVDDGLSTETEILWGKYIKQMHYDYMKNEGENVEFPCSSKVTRAIFRQYPKSTYRWSVNEEPVDMDTSRMFLFKGTFSIRDLTYEDAGVYMCILEYRKQDFKTVGIYPLTVKTEKVTHTIRETDDLELNCNSDVFSLNYPGIEIEWFFNETKYDVKSKGNLSETLVIKDVETKSAGIWSCTVKDPKSSRVWHSAWYNVAVAPPPPKYEQFYIFVKENKLMSGLTVLGCLVIVLLVVGVCICTAQKTKQKNERKMGAMKDHVMSMQTDNLFGIQNMNLEVASSLTETTVLSMEEDTYSEMDVTTNESSRLMSSY